MPRWIQSSRSEVFLGYGADVITLTLSPVQVCRHKSLQFYQSNKLRELAWCVDFHSVQVQRSVDTDIDPPSHRKVDPVRSLLLWQSKVNLVRISKLFVVHRQNISHLLDDCSQINSRSQLKENWTRLVLNCFHKLEQCLAAQKGRKD